MTTGKYEYDDRTWAEIDLMVRKSMPSGSRLCRSPLQEDFDGIDVQYTVNDRVPLALRVRFDRPAYASDCDITFRSTEPAKMSAATYAPLMLYLWLKAGVAAAGKLIDVYRLYHSAEPPLEERPVESNHDGTSWLPVPVSELHEYRALLRQGDREAWCAAVLGGNERTKRIIAVHSRVRS